MDPVPRIVSHTLVEYMNHLKALRGRADGVDSPPSDLLAARFCLTGIAEDNSFLAGISTAPDVLSGSHQVPYIRRDLDSVLGYSSNNPVMAPVHYYPYPNPARTLEHRVHVIYKAEIDGQVIA